MVVPQEYSVVVPARHAYSHCESVRPLMSGNITQILGAFSICMVMSWNGLWIGTVRLMLPGTRWWILRALYLGPKKELEVVVGITTATDCVRLTVLLLRQYLTLLDYVVSVLPSSKSSRIGRAPNWFFQGERKFHLVGQPWVEPGATAHDVRDGNLSGRISVSGLVDVNTTGLCTHLCRV